ncbi:cyanophycinase [Mitsuaria sp. GD03876]|uniref:cyanophycinase n=1 Tax=Mitsuaria sp. GD03876 TaxID=2975399 RepID=UPI0024473A13|nr:cyanophycinase [Mitsuaria sp. GD03876]MDH0866278.1 cyanophycinase [Mitsuaria sp. GD03876]
MDAFRSLSIRIRALLGAMALLGAGVASAQTAIVIGGALRMDNDAVWQRIVDEAGGAGQARFAVLATAAANPELSAKLIVDVLKKHGAQAEHIPVAPRLEGADLQRNLHDPELIAKVRASNAVFFSGGAQGFIVDTLQPGGRRTEMLDAIWDVYRRGGVVAGTSAGAAIMSRVMFRDALNVMDVLRGTMRDGHEIDQGLGFVGGGLFVDQHFLKRGRIGRMLPLMMAKGYRLGLGVEENSAAVIHGDRVDIIGGRGALLVDLRDARSDPALGMFNLRGARLSYLDSGDRHDLASGVTQPAARKTAASPAVAMRASTQGAPLPRGPVDTFQPDILGDNRIVQAMTELLSSPAAEVRAMAARIRPGATADRDRTGFVFRLYRGAGTQGWIDADGDARDVTLLDVRLDVRPVRLPDPNAAAPATNAVPAASLIAPAGLR